MVAAGQELVGRHPVELGEPQEARHRDRPLAPLVGTEDRGLEFLVGAGLDVVQRQALLPPDRAQALSDMTTVDLFHIAFSPPCAAAPREGPYH